MLFLSGHRLARRFGGDSARVSEAAETSNEILIAKRFRVSLDQRIPELDTLGGVAYAAADMVSPERPVFVLAMRPGFPYREQILKKLLVERQTGYLAPLAQEIITLSGGQAGERLAVVLNCPTGGRVFAGGPVIPAIMEKELRARAIPQLLEGLESLHDIGVSHRGITLKNIFCHSDGKILLGECFSCPPGMINSPLQEPLDSAQASAAARGEGSPAHDMFALGVLLMSLYLGRDVGASVVGPEGKDFDRIMSARFRQGSYHALAGGQEITGMMGDLLRGLLDDNAENRWGIEDVKWWLGGLSPRMKAAHEPWVLVRPIAFEDKIMQDRRQLAFALSRNVPAAAKLIRSGKFLPWIEQTLIEALEPEWLEKSLDTRSAAMVGEAGALADEWAVTRACAVLDPEGPIRFKGQAFCVDGIGAALAVFEAEDATTKLDDLRLLITGEPFRHILEILKGRNSALDQQYRRLFDATRYIENSSLGQGFERVLYVLNPQITCLSPRLAAYHTDTAERLLEAIESRARDDHSGGGWMDEDIAAFISCQSRELEEAVKLLDQVKLKPTAYAAASLRLLGALQKRVRLRSLPKLARLLSEPIRKVLGDLHGRTFKRQAYARLDALVEQGDLTRLAKEFNVAGLQYQDDQNFRAAQYQFSMLNRECRRLERASAPSDPAARQLGYLGSACFSVAVLFITAIYLLVHSFARWA